MFDFTGAWELLKPLIYILIGMTIYAVFIFKFYRFLAKKDIFALNLRQYNRARHPFFQKILHIILYITEYLLIFPLLVFFWFIILTILLSFIVKDPLVSNILLISIALVGAVRITAYYNEDLSKDLAKMLPFTILGIYLIDATYVSFTNSWAFIQNLPSEINMILYYLIFLILLEFVLRIAYFVIKGSKAETPKEEIEIVDDIV